MLKNNKLSAFDLEESMACDHMHHMIEDQFVGIVEMIKNQQKTSIELTRLVLEYGGFSDLDEKKIHKIFMNAAEVVGKSFDKSFGK